MEDKHSSTCFFTGHRSIPRSEMSSLTAAIDETVEELIDWGIDTFVCGGAVGFDTLAACRVVVAKKRHPEIMLSGAVFCFFVIPRSHANGTGNPSPTVWKQTGRCQKTQRFSRADVGIGPYGIRLFSP